MKRTPTIPVGQDPGPYKKDVDPTELRRRTVGLIVGDENSQELAGFRAPGEGERPPKGPAIAAVDNRRKRVKAAVRRASNTRE